ncbi:hypothetical protein M9H77_31025 [Catharanthus roseus]|uniref:Uncharacterized protein n=1 Tax=Catharanthus roseus TaxID=4058 RepID=A0ACC0A185_CATRO|nr:hypothetical protein M9H77_31025 [Catharanthus roseus]
MAPKDEELMTFRTPKVIYYSKVMSFDLKNTSATYQRATQRIFDDMLHKIVKIWWYLQLQQFEIVYVPQKAIKGQVLANFLVEHPILTEWKLTDDLLDEDLFLIEILPPWKMYFDGVAPQDRTGTVMFITSESDILPYSFTLTKKCPNNMVEYQALILGLGIVVNMKQLHLRIYGDSKLVVNQILDIYDVEKPKLLPYCKYAKLMMGWLGDVEIEHVP